MTRYTNELFGRHREAILYVLFGGFTTLVSWGTYAAFVTLGLMPVISNVLSWVCGVLFAFVTNKFFVFESSSVEHGVVSKEFSRFVGCRIFTGVLSWLIFPALIHLGLSQDFMGIDGMWARVFTSGIEIVINWALSKYLVFADTAGRRDRSAFSALT